MSALRCRIGLHDFQWPAHRYPSRLWQDYHVECGRGCGARTVMTCHNDRHWVEKHPVPNDD